MEVPRSFFKDTCNDCFDRKAKILCESLTGKDSTQTKDRDHIRGVYEHAEKSKNNSDLVGRTAIIKAIELIIVAVLVFIGLKVVK